jgi:hypothetical protein
VRRLIAVVSLLALGVAGCATVPTPTLAAFAERSADNSFEVLDRAVGSPNALVLPVVHDRQTSGPSCGAHALASIVNYWHRDANVTGEAIFAATPPAQPQGYSMAELIVLAAQHDLLASGVRLPPQGVVDELERGRPVLVPVRLPSIYVQPRTLPGENVAGLGLATGLITHRVGRLSEWTGLTMVDHYLLVVGHDEDRFVVVEPVRGYRTISAQKLGRYREPFGDAAIVFSAATNATTTQTASGSRAPSSASAPAEGFVP